MTDALLLKPIAAARLLAISPRTLWALTKKDEIPHIRLGNCLRYDVKKLREFLDNASCQMDSHDIITA